MSTQALLDKINDARDQQVAAIEAQAKEDAASRVKMNLVFEAVAKAEGLDVAEEKVEAEYQKLAETHKLELNYVKQVVSPDQLKKDLLPQLGYELVIESAVKK